jgi:hypothetical protein
MQADAAAIDKNVVAEGNLLVVMLALAGSDMDGAAALVKSSHTLICEIPTVEAVRGVLILGSISTV